MNVREHTPDLDPDFSKMAPEGLLKKLRGILSPGSLITDEELLRPYECDGLSAYRRLPLAVALPEDEAQVEAIMKACHQAGVPIVPRGGGTGLSCLTPRVCCSA
jgi:glycolate oxidase